MGAAKDSEFFLRAVDSLDSLKSANTISLCFLEKTPPGACGCLWAGEEQNRMQGKQNLTNMARRWHLL